MSTVRTVDAADEKRLAELGYKQELQRSWGLLQVCRLSLIVLWSDDETWGE